MVEAEYTIDRSEGFHLRPAGILANLIKKYDCKATMIYKDQEIDATNVIAMVAACIKNGDNFKIKCEGPQEAECIAAINEIAKTDLG